MNKLTLELQRLYFLEDQRYVVEARDEGPLNADVVARNLAGEASVELELVDTGGQVRTLVVAFAHAADWPHAINLYQAVQDELDLPAPALGVAGRYLLWFSLAQVVPVAQASVFLAALRARYLDELPAKRLAFYPSDSTTARIALLPGRNAANEQWSAFIDPTLGGMFSDDQWLAMAPSPDKQAELLGAFKSITPAAFDAALCTLQGEAMPLAAAPAPVSAPPRRGARLGVGSDYRDPRSFLLAVMNDESASARQRIAAAKALLPYYAAQPES